MSHAWHDVYTFISEIVTISGAISIVAGAALWLFNKVAMPKIRSWIKTNVLDPISEARKATDLVKQDVAAVKVATTVNGHSQEEPTLRDDLSDIKKHLARQDKNRAADRAAFGRLSKKLGAHLEVADADHAALMALADDVKAMQANR